MTGDGKKTKTDPAAKKEAAPKDKGSSGVDSPKAGVEPAKAEGGEKAARAPAGYSRGEGQKPVTKAYKDNWNAIYAKKKKKR